MAHVLTINGTAYAQSGRKTRSMVLDGFGWDYEGDAWCDFHEYCAGPQPYFARPYAVSLTVDGTLRFSGWIAQIQPGWSDSGQTWGYRCLGKKWAANQIPVTAVDGSGLITYNLAADSEDYLPSMSGKSVGQIVSGLLSSHSSQLAALGITTDATTASQLAGLTLVPSDPVYISGERFWLALETVLQRWARNLRTVITPAGLVRFVDITSGTSRTLTLGTDPVVPPLFSRDWNHCATRVIARGKGDIAPAYVSLSQGTLEAAWSSTEQDDWTWADFATPGDAFDEGTVTTTGGPTSITVKSNSLTRNWPTNFWNDRQAWIYLQSGSGTGLTYSEARPVSACTSLSAGGTATITLGYPLDNSGSGAWSTYQLIGKVAPLGSPGGRNNVYRLFNVVTPGHWIEQHLVKRFPQPVPFIGLNNSSAQLVNTPCCLVLLNLSGGSQSFRVNPTDGTVLFDRPIVETFNSQEALNLGGSAVTIPDEIYMMLAYSRGALQAIYPPDVGGVPQYAGTAYSAAGLQRTHTVDVETWAYKGNQATMVSFAQMMHQSMCDTVVEGAVRYQGQWTAVLDPTGGHRLCFAGNGYTTGDESLNVPVRSVSFQLQSTGGGLQWTTELRVSSRRDPRTDEGFYQHLSQLGEGGLFRAASSFGDLGSMFRDQMASSISGPGPDSGGAGFDPGGLDLDFDFGRTGQNRPKKPRFVGPPKPSEMVKSETPEQRADRRKSDEAIARDEIRNRQLAERRAAQERERNRKRVVPDDVLDSHLERLAKGD